MSIVTSNFVSVIGGVDTHQDLHTAAVVSTSGEVLGTALLFDDPGWLPGHAALVPHAW